MYQWPPATSSAKKILYGAIGLFYCLFLGKPVQTALSLLPASFLLNVIRGAQFWIHRFCRQKCLWSCLSTAPYEIKKRGVFHLHLGYQWNGTHVTGHASTENHLRRDDFHEMVVLRYFKNF